MSSLLKQFNGIKDLDWVSAELDGMNIVKDEAILLVPVDSGNLQSTIDVEVDGETVNLVAGGNGVDYHLHVEFGTVKMAAQPYMRPAIDTKKGEVTRAIAKNLQAQIKARL